MGVSDNIFRTRQPVIKYFAPGNAVQFPAGSFFFSSIFWQSLRYRISNISWELGALELWQRFVFLQAYYCYGPRIGHYLTHKNDSVKSSKCVCDWPLQHAKTVEGVYVQSTDFRYNSFVTVVCMYYCINFTIIPPTLRFSVNYPISVQILRKLTNLINICK